MIKTPNTIASLKKKLHELLGNAPHHHPRYDLPPGEWERLHFKHQKKLHAKYMLEVDPWLHYPPNEWKRFCRSRQEKIRSKFLKNKELDAPIAPPSLTKPVIATALTPPKYATVPATRQKKDRDVFSKCFRNYF